MILSTRGGAIRVIRQDDHAELAGVLAREWGNHTFARPEPFDAVALATSLHDNGWRDWDAAPRVNPASQRPYQFTEMPVHEHLTFYRQGVERVVARDRYAGLLVNMHCVGLYNQRYGVDASLPMKTHGTAEQAVIDEFRTALEAQQKSLWAELARTCPDPAARDESRLWGNYKLLQIFDRLSLYLCMPPYQARTLGPAPVNATGVETELAFRPAAENAVVVAPYPFGESPLWLTVAVRFIPDRPYTSGEDLRTTLAAVSEEILTVEIRK
jgi:hypothetical protein